MSDNKLYIHLKNNPVLVVTVIVAVLVTGVNIYQGMDPTNILDPAYLQGLAIVVGGIVARLKAFGPVTVEVLTNEAAAHAVDELLDGVDDSRQPELLPSEDVPEQVKFDPEYEAAQRRLNEGSH